MSPPDLSIGTNRQNEINAAQKMKEKQEAEERALNETAQEMKGNEKAEERTLNEMPTDATKNATTQKHPPKCRRQAAQTSTRLRVRGGGSGYGVSRTPLPSVLGRFLG